MIERFAVEIAMVPSALGFSHPYFRSSPSPTPAYDLNISSCPWGVLNEPLHCRECIWVCTRVIRVLV